MMFANDLFPACRRVLTMPLPPGVPFLLM